MSGDLFVKAQDNESLEDFVARMVAPLCIANIERRESSNYVGERYFKGEALAVTIKFAIADEVGLEEYDFWIQLESSEVWIEQPGFEDGLADVVARRLTHAGDRVARVPNAHMASSRKIVYLIDDSDPSGSKGRIVTTEG